MNWVYLIVVLALFQSLVFSGMTGWARGKYKVPAPATVGHEIFERYYRVHYNTNEQLLLFVPSMWAFANYVSLRWAVVLGCTYLAGRVFYAVGYILAPAKRELGFGLTYLANLTLLTGSAIGIIRAILAGGSIGFG